MFPGGVDEYLRLTASSSGAVSRSQAPAAAPAPAQTEAARGLSNAERQRLKEIASLERKMDARRERVEELERGMFDIDPTDFAALSSLQDEISAARWNSRSSSSRGLRRASGSRARVRTPSRAERFALVFRAVSLAPDRLTPNPGDAPPLLTLKG